MTALKNLILKLKPYFKYFIIGYASLYVLSLFSYLAYMVIYNVKYKNEYNVDYTVYSAKSFISYILGSIVFLAILALLIYLLIKKKDKEAKFLFTGWFIYSLVYRIFNLMDGFDNAIYGDAAGGILTFLIFLSLVFAMGAIMLEVFNGNKKFSEFSPLCFIIAFGLSIISMILTIIGSFDNNSLVFPFYVLINMFFDPLFIIILALIAYTYITPADDSNESNNTQNAESSESNNEDTQNNEEVQSAESTDVVE